MFVYRDTAGQPGDTGRAPGPNDPSYWYDLAGTGPAEETPQASGETRGPFEPLVSSADPPGTVRGSAAGPEAAGPDAAPASGVPGEDEQDMVYAQARKLEQIKDLYLTAEAIGEANVDKHFDQLLAQQRELISEYFKQAPAAAASGPDDQAEAGPGAPGPPAPGSGFPAGASENPRVTAEQPRVW